MILRYYYSCHTAYFNIILLFSYFSIFFLPRSSFPSPTFAYNISKYDTSVSALEFCAEITLHLVYVYFNPQTKFVDQLFPILCKNVRGCHSSVLNYATLSFSYCYFS